MNELNKDSKLIKSLLRVKKETLLEDYISNKKTLDLLQTENDWLKGIFDLYQECIEQGEDNEALTTLSEEFRQRIDLIEDKYEDLIKN